MRILAAILLIGLASEAEAESVSADLARKVMTKGEIIAYKMGPYWTEYHVRYKDNVYICSVNIEAKTQCVKTLF